MESGDSAVYLSRISRLYWPTACIELDPYLVLQASLKRLQADYVDVIYCHRCEALRILIQ